ncbi:MAG: hypothetical protein ACOCQQ_01745 [Candidatus Nanoarchaeia archaeon]
MKYIVLTLLLFVFCNHVLHASDLDCYDNAELNAAEYYLKKNNNENIEAETVISLDRNGDKCIKNDVYEGELIYDEDKLFVKFSDLYPLYYNAAKNEDFEKFDYFMEELAPIEKDMDSYLKLHKNIVPPGKIATVEKMMQELDLKKIRANDYHRVKSGLIEDANYSADKDSRPLNYMLLVDTWLNALYVKFGGKVKPDCKLRKIDKYRVPGDKPMSPLTFIIGLAGYDSEILSLESFQLTLCHD